MEINESTSKMQYNVENACINDMWQLGFKPSVCYLKFNGATFTIAHKKHCDSKENAS